ncbi:MAG: 6-carboxytetrahydropterin synthase QueD [Calditrichaeota bacterium]|nr:6-carboxytetrahydropterin synthase QueD [Calditrichota bacterium]
MYKLAIETMISASHFLSDYRGPCQRIHGHNWKIQVEITGDQLNKTGMVIDFKDLSDLTWSVVGKYDHQSLNELPPFDRMNPTAENMARYFFKEIDKILPAGVKMRAIRLWETDKYMVEYTE